MALVKPFRSMTEQVGDYSVAFNLFENGSFPINGLKQNYEVRIQTVNGGAIMKKFFDLCGINQIYTWNEDKPLFDTLKDPIGNSISESDASNIVKTIKKTVQNLIPKLFVCQRLCSVLESNPVHQFALRRMMIKLVQKANVNMDTQNLEFEQYALALSARLAQDIPSDWDAWRNALPSTKDMGKNLDRRRSLWKYFFTMVLRGLRSRSPDERSGNSCWELANREFIKVARDGLQLFLKKQLHQQEGKEDSKDEDYVDDFSFPFSSLEDALSCAVCFGRFSSIAPPITFGDGRTVCRSCCNKKKFQLLQRQIFETAERVENLETNEDPTPMADIFGNSNDVTLGKFVEIVSSKLDPDFSSSEAVKFKRIGNDFYAKGRYKEAVLAYSKGLEKAPYHPVLYCNRSGAWLKLKNLAEARGDALAAIKYSKGHWGKPFFRLASAHPGANSFSISAKEREWKKRNVFNIDESEFPEISEEEFVQMRYKKSKLIDESLFDRWLIDPELSIEAAASMLRAFILGERLYNGVMRAVASIILADVSQLKGIDDDEGIENGLTIKLFNELFESKILKEQLKLSHQLPETPIESISQLVKDNVSEFECTLCYSLLCDPVTFPCGHSFCRLCAIRAMDHSTAQGEPKCPMCRSPLEEYIEALNDVAFQRNQKYDLLEVGLESVQINRALEACLKLVFKEEYHSTLESNRLQENSMVTESLKPFEEEVPIVAITNVPLPGIRSTIVLWEPSDRLMMRRVASINPPEDRKFGICLDLDDDLMAPFGLIVKIESFRNTMSGELMVTCIGHKRFKILSKHERDGYIVARVRVFRDSFRARDLIDNFDYQDNHFDRNYLTMCHVLESARENNWVDTPHDLLEVELSNLWKSIQAGLDFRDITGMVDVFEAEFVPYYIAYVLCLPPQYLFFLIFARSLRFSFTERIRFLLRAIPFPLRIWEPRDSERFLDNFKEFYPDFEVEALLDPSQVTLSLLEAEDELEEVNEE